MMKKMLMALVLMPLMALAGTLSFEAESSNPSVAGGLWIEAVDLEDSLAYESLNQRVNAGEKVFFNGARPVSGFTQIKQIPFCCYAVKMTGSQASLVKVDFEVDTPSGTFTKSVQDITGDGFFGGFSMDALFNLKDGTYTLRATASADGCRPVTTAIKLTVKGTGRTVRNSLGYISNDIVRGALGGAGCSLQSEDGWIGVSGDSVVTACLGMNESAQLLVHYYRPVFIVFNAAMVGDGDEFSVTVTGDGFSPSRYELSSGKGYYVGCIGQDGRSGGTILWQYKRGSSKLLLQDMHYSELYNFRCYDVIKVSFDSAGGGTVPPILAVCGHAYNAIEQFPENGPTPPKSKNGEKYEFEGWYNSEGVRVTGNSMVPEYSDDHTLMARWKVSGDERPDLYIASASASPVTIMLSERTAIKYTLVNGGKKSAGQTSTHFVADTCWTSLGNGPLAAGASETCTKHISGRELGLGTHQIRIQADAPNDVEESNEDNNSYYVTVVVVNDNPQPYVPSGQTVRVSFDPDGGKVDPTSYEYTIGSAYGWFPTPTRDGYAFLGWSQYRDGYVRKSTSDIVSADVLTLYAVWDRGQDLKFYVPDGISASFFLVAKDVSNAKPNVLTVGDTPILRCYIANAGVYSVKGFKVAFKFQGETYYNKKWVDREIGAGDWSYIYETEDFLRGLDAGTYSLTCIIDSENSVQEVDEGNNEQTIEFCVMPLPPVEVRFNPNGGVVVESMRMVDGGGAIGVLPVPERQGCDFAGWFTSKDGGTKISATTKVTADVVYYAHWTARMTSVYPELASVSLNKTQLGISDSLTVAFRIANPSSSISSEEDNLDLYIDGVLTLGRHLEKMRSSGGLTSTIYVYSATMGPGAHTIMVKLRNGVGSFSNTVTVVNDKTADSGMDWAFHKLKSSEPDALYLGSSLNDMSGRTSFTVEQPIFVEVHFWNANKVRNLDPVHVKLDLSTGASTSFMWNSMDPGVTGYLSDDVRMPAMLQNLPVGSYTLTATIDPSNNWWETDENNNVKRINFTVVAASVPHVPTRTESLYLYDGSEASVAVDKGEVAPYATAAAIYDGYVVQDGVVKGSIQVKVAKGKVDKKTGVVSAKVTATVQLVGEKKKLNFKGGVADAAGTVSVMSSGGHELSISLGVNGLGGTLDGTYVIDGARNVFSAKDAESKATAKEIESMWVGAINVVGDDVALAVSVAKKGKVKVSGTVNGAKVTATSQLLVGADACCVPVVITKKANLAFNLWLMDDGTVEVVVGGSWFADRGSWFAAAAGTLKSGATFAFGDAAAKGLAALPGLLTQYLPNGLEVMQNKTKWVVAPDANGKAAKAGKVMFNKKTGEIDEAKLGENPSALKLTYTAKTGSFKGSFKAYTLLDNKVKAYTFNITGVMIGDKAYGTATLKNPAVSIPIVIE